MKTEFEKEELIQNEIFLEFLSRNFDKTAIHATVEDIANFAFGSFEEAVKAYIEETK